MTLIAILLLLAIVGVVAFLVLRGRNPAAPNSDGALEADTVVRVDTQISMPQAAPRKESFDAGATQVYMRPDLEAAPAEARQRDGTAAPVHSARLIGVSGSLKGHAFTVAPAGITIGRNGRCDVVIADSRISNRHAWIGIVDGRALLRDLKSTNGTFLNTHTRTPITEAELRNGDTIIVGGHQGDQFRIVLE